MDEKYEEIDHSVSHLYEIKKRIGKGAYGIVWEATDKKTKKLVAVKKIFDAFRNKTDAMRTYREVIFMKEFQFHPNIIQLVDMFKAENNLDIYLVMERMDADLHSVIEGNLLKPIHKSFIMFQLISALDCLNTFNVIHRDLKPSNILLNANCHVRVADFGLARCTSGTMINEQEDAPMTDYVATRWYRAPEILLSDQIYTCGVDMWSCGCILGEMLLGKPLFPGSSTVNQIELIVESIQLPQVKDIELSSQYARTILEKASSKPKRNFVSRFREIETETEAIDLLTKLLIFQPDKRLTAQQALNHPYVIRFGPPDRESWPSTQRQFKIEDDTHLSISDYRQRLYQLIENKHVLADKLPINKLGLYENNPENSPLKQNPNRNGINSEKAYHDLSQPIDPHAYESSPKKTVESPAKTKKDYLSWFPPAGLPSSHPRSTLSNAQLRYHCPGQSGTTSYNSSPVRQSANSTNSSFSPMHHPHSIKSTNSVSINSTKSSNAARVRCGRRQFGNLSNVSSLGSPKLQMQSYAQDHGTITASSLQQLQLGL